MNLLGAAGLGLALGAITGVPLGVVNVAVADAATTHRRHAIGIGIGGALADTVHALLAFIGVGRLVTERPDLVRILAIVAAIAIVGYAVIAWRRHRARHTTQTLAGPLSLARGIPAGLALTLPNPGALTAWVAIAAALWPRADVGEAIALGIGVGIGSAAWFALLAHLVARLRPDHVVLRRLPVVALVIFVVIAISGIARAL